MLVYTARFLLPITSDPIVDGAFAVEGERLVACGPRRDVLENVGPDVEVRNLGHCAVLPGLINCHVHLELSWMAADRPPAGDYVTWVRGLLARRSGEDPRRARGAAMAEAKRLVARGTVAVGDVANQEWTAPILAGCGLHGVVFHELLGPRRAEAAGLLASGEARLAAWRADPAIAAAAGRVRIVLAPHAPHTVSGPLLRGLADLAASRRDPLSIHAAESREESAWLMDGSGALGRLFEERGFGEPGWRPPGLSPVAYLDRLGVLSPRTLVVHGVQLGPTDRRLLRARGATVVACLRSNLALGVGRPDLPGLLRANVPVALGTDSLASAPDLDLFAELAAVRESYPMLAPSALLRMATHHGARALGLDDRLGSLAPGRLARLVVVPLVEDETDPARAICSNPPTVYPLSEAPREGAR